MLIHVGRKKGEKELGGLALKLLVLLASHLRERLVTQRWLLELWISGGEYQQCLEQKCTFSLTVPSSSYMVLN